MALRVLIVGGGFGGLNVARSLRSTAYEITLVDKRNFHLFQPLLYQVATGGLAASNIAAPLRSILERARNCRVVLDRVRDFDPDGRRVLTDRGPLTYDALVVAAGARTHYFGRNDWEGSAPGLKTLEDAAGIRSRILMAFEAAEQADDPEPWLRFVVVGGGPTGVELAGTLGEMTRYTLRHEFRRIDPTRAEILLVEAGPRVLPAFDEKLSAHARKDLERLGVTVLLDTRVTAVDEESITLGDRAVPCRTVVWAAGVRASGLADKLAAATGAEQDDGGRIRVAEALHLAAHPEIFVIGDMARRDDGDGNPLPGVAPVAMQQGKHVAKVLEARRRGRPEPAFRYRDYGTMATIGRSKAVAVIGKRSYTGWLAWLLWLFIHLVQLVLYEKRLLVLIQWAWNYVTFSRASRLIVGRSVTTDPE